MDNTPDNLEKMTTIFGNTFLLERRLEYIVDNELESANLTAKQWLLFAVIDKVFDTPPSIKDVAGQLYSSHQNIKAMAVNMEKKGFLRIEKDSADKRVSRLVLTEKAKEFWRDREAGDLKFIARLFSCFSEEELEQYLILTGTFLNHLEDIQKTSK